MNKHQKRAIASLEVMHSLGGYEINIAQGLSALIRASLTNKSKAALMEYAVKFNVINHSSFII
jgi:hypothetical protein